VQSISDLVGSWVSSYSSPSFCRHDNKPVIANSDINEMLPTYLPAPDKEIFSPAHETFLPSLANKYRRLPFWKYADMPGIDVTIRKAQRSTVQGLDNRRCICSLDMHTIEPLERNPCDQGAIILSISKIAREETPSHALTSERHTRRFDVRRFNTQNIKEVLNGCTASIQNANCAEMRANTPMPLQQIWATYTAAVKRKCSHEPLVEDTSVTVRLNRTIVWAAATIIPIWDRHSGVVVFSN
jgi:hypothetical protein